MKLLGKSTGLISLFVLQLVCVIFLLGDAALDILGLDQPTGVKESDFLEYLVVIALVFSLIATGYQIYKLLRRAKSMEDQLKIASGRFAELLEQYFAEWNLTTSECDVAMLAIKGMDISEIAALRDTKEGTVKAQLNAIYRKAGVTGRPQLISSFIEELMGNILIEQSSDSISQK